MQKRYLAEWGETVRNRAFFVELDRLKSLTGYESVYRFREDAAKAMYDRGSVVGCMNYAVWTDRLIIDLDDGSTTAKKLIKILDDLGLAYLIYFSGSKGYHFIIPCVPMFGLDVPYTQMKWVEKLGIPFDTTLYRHNSMVRLPGTIHEKTGLKKKLIKIKKGKKLKFNKILDNPKRYQTWQGSEGVLSTSHLQNIFVKGLRLIRTTPGLGQRHTELWSIANDFANCGISFETAFELINQLNLNWGDSSKDEDEVYRAVEDAYNYAG